MNANKIQTFAKIQSLKFWRSLPGLKQPITEWPAEPGQASRRPGMNEREILRLFENKPYIEFIAAQRFDIGCSIATNNSPISMPNFLSSLPFKTLFMDGFVECFFLSVGANGVVRCRQIVQLVAGGGL